MGEAVSQEAAEVVRPLRDPATEIGAAAVMLAAEARLGPRVPEALLWCALDGAEHLRVHAAALALYHAGGAPESFDWKQRPLFLQFGESDRTVRLPAVTELRRRMKAT